MALEIPPYTRIPMIAGPTTLHPAVFESMRRDFGSGQHEADFLPFYAETAKALAVILNTGNDVVLMTGEAMLVLWGALKSCLAAGDRVLTIGTGVFGDGFADMAASFGCEVEKISLPYDSTIGNHGSLERIEEAVRRFKPRMITAVHCETPSGTLNPLAGLGEIKKRLAVPLLCVDAVSSAGGAPVDADAWNADLVLVGSQKCLSAPPSMSIVAVSPAAWERMAEVNYQGYDAILPFKTIYRDGRCPYTPYWHGVAVLNTAAGVILKEGLDAAHARHARVAAQCREGLARLGISLFPRPEAVCSPTVTAAMIPKGFSWPDWRNALRQRGLAVSGSFGPMNGKVFRLGHMGVQACETLMGNALAAIEDLLKKNR